MAAKSTVTFAAATAEVIARAFAEWDGLVITPERDYVAADVEGLAAYSDGKLAASITWAIEHEHGGAAEFVTLVAHIPGRGHGRAVMAEAEELLRSRGVRRVSLITTNTNAGAIALYLSRGYRLVRLHLDAMDTVRARKPGVPLVEHGLPLRDMWRFAKDFE